MFSYGTVFYSSGILHPTLNLQAYSYKRVQGMDKMISKFAESFVLLIDQIEPKPSKQKN